MAVGWVHRWRSAWALAALVGCVGVFAKGPDELALIDFGRALFFDQRLSANGQISCASCHQPERAFTDGRATAVGVTGEPGTRNSPSLLGVATVPALFWDGRAASLEQQALLPFTTPIEMGLPSLAALLDRVRHLPSYSDDVQQAFNKNIAQLRAEDIALALARFQRSLTAGPSAFDRYTLQGQPTALSAGALRGMALFKGQAGCSSCHRIEAGAASFTDHAFHAIGFRGDPAQLAQAIERLEQTPAQQVGQRVLTDPQVAALGRYISTRALSDIGKFRTPSLRNVARTAPYMHDGAIPTLEAAIDYELYYRGQADGSPRILTPQERADLAEFLRALDSEQSSFIFLKTKN